NMAAGIRVGDEPPSRAARELRASPVSTVDDGRQVFAPRQRNEEEIGRWHHCTLAKRGDASGGAGRGHCSPEDPCPGQTANAAGEASNAVAVLRLALKTPLQRHESCPIFFVL